MAGLFPAFERPTPTPEEVLTPPPPVLGPTYYRDALLKVLEAIAKIEANEATQGYMIEGRQVQKARLEGLYAERARLEPLALRESGHAPHTIRFSATKGT